MVGDAYRQEYLPGVAEDQAEVTSISESVTVPYGSWSGTVVRTREWSPLEQKIVENKYYAPHVGLVKEDTVKGGSSGTVLIAVRRD